jgi:hypothetical protein
VAVTLGQIVGDVAELGGKILVNEEKMHEIAVPSLVLGFIGMIHGHRLLTDMIVGICSRRPQ